MNFREYVENPAFDIVNKKYHDIEVANIYFSGQKKVREISQETKRSVGEIYKIIRKYGSPNRTRNDQSVVISLSDSGLPVKSVANFTGYSTRQVRNILNGRISE